MKKKFTLLVLGFFVLTLNPLIGQYNFNYTGGEEPCGTDYIHQKMLQENADYAQKMQAFNNYTANKISNSQRNLEELYTIPVVVHVIQDGTSTTEITEQQIRDAIQGANYMFRNVSGTFGGNSQKDANIQFALAVRDPDGNCTNGITYTDLSGIPDYVNFGTKYVGPDGFPINDIKSMTFWNTYEYYNICVVNTIDNGSSVAGFAALAGAHGNFLDGTVILASSIRVPSDKTLSHELGHALNLYHTFEGGNQNTCPHLVLVNQQEILFVTLHLICSQPLALAIL